MSDAELVVPVFWDGTLLAEQDVMGEGLFGRLDSYAAPTSLYRLTAADAPRVYFKRNPVRTFPSVTSVISATTPTSKFLTTWIAQMGIRQAEAYRDARASFGTLMHQLFGEFLISRSFDLSRMPEYVDGYAKTEMLTCDTGTWAGELRGALVGLADFVRDFNVRPIGIEIPLASDKLGWAGCIDLIALIDKPKKKNVLAEIDFKSGQFHDSAEIQTGAYAMLWNEVYYGTPVSEIFLFGPKDFDERSKTRYRLQNVTDSPLRDLMPNLLEQFLVRNPKRDPILEISETTISLDADHDHLVKFTPIETIIERLEAPE